jgi:uncharacterized protein (DUF488 family)
MPAEKNIWTIGHSTRPMQVFLEMLRSFQIKCIADVRHYPGSRRYPHFNKDHLQNELPVQGIRYIHLVDLGGRRKPLPASVNTAWRHSAFRGYADYMQSDAFYQALQELKELALEQRTAFMCSEAVWWSCHRSLIADRLKVEGWRVWHIMDVNKAVEHPYTSAASIVDGRLHYDQPA